MITKKTISEIEDENKITKEVATSRRFGRSQSSYYRILTFHKIKQNRKATDKFLLKGFNK